jgi:hypothetical protein
MSKGKGEGDKFTADSHQPTPPPGQMKRREAHLECGREAAALTFFPERGMWREITAAVIEKRQLRGRTPNAIFMAEPQGRSAGPRPTPSNRPEMVPGMCEKIGFAHVIHNVNH